jgi:hypothetical protein
MDIGQRHLKVTTTKMKADYTDFIQWLVKEHYPYASKIKLVQDNFGTHSYGAFDENLPFEDIRQLKKNGILFYPETRLMVKHGRNRIFIARSPMLRQTNCKPRNTRG